MSKDSIEDKGIIIRDSPDSFYKEFCCKREKGNEALA